MSFLKVMTLILVHLEEFQIKHAFIRISLADKVKLIEDSKKQNILLSLHLKVVMITRF